MKKHFTTAQGGANNEKTIYKEYKCGGNMHL